MGSFQIPGQYSGRNYNIQIDGDFPSAEDQARATEIIRQREADFKAQFEAEFGPDNLPDGWGDDGTAIGRGLDRGATSGYEQFGELNQYLGETTGWNWLENKGREMVGKAKVEQIREATNLTDPTDWRDIRGLSSAATYVGEQLGQTAIQTGAGLVGGAIAGLAAPTVGVPVAVGAIAGGAVANSPFFAGGNIQRQKEETGTVDPLKLVLATAGQSVTAIIADRLMVGPLGKVFGGAGASRVGNALKGAGQGAVAELPSEVWEQVLERWQAGLSLTDDEAMREYTDAAAGALAVGGSIGGVSGAVRGRRVDTNNPPPNLGQGETPPSGTPLARDEDDPAEVQQATSYQPENLEGSEYAGLIADIVDGNRPLTSTDLDTIGVSKGHTALRAGVDRGDYRLDQILGELDRYALTLRGQSQATDVSRGERIGKFVEQTRGAIQQREQADLLAGERQRTERAGSEPSVPDAVYEQWNDTGQPNTGAAPAAGPGRLDAAGPEAGKVAEGSRPEPASVEKSREAQPSTFAPVVNPEPPAQTRRVFNVSEFVPDQMAKAAAAVHTKAQEVMANLYGDAKRPVLTTLRDKYKIQFDPKAKEVQNLREEYGLVKGATPRLFTQGAGARKSLGSLRVEEAPELADLVAANPDGFYDAKDLAQALADERAGQPRQPQEVRDAFADIRRVTDMEEAVTELNALLKDRKELALTSAEAGYALTVMNNNGYSAEEALETVFSRDLTSDRLDKLSEADAFEAAADLSNSQEAKLLAALEEKGKALTAFQMARVAAPAPLTPTGEVSTPAADGEGEVSSVGGGEVEAEAAAQPEEISSPPAGPPSPPNGAGGRGGTGSGVSLAPEPEPNTEPELGLTPVPPAAAEPAPVAPAPAEPAPAPQWDRDATPGAVTGAPGQIIPPAIPPVEGSIAAPAPGDVQTTGSADRAANRRLAEVDKRIRDKLTVELTDEYTKRVPKAARDYARRNLYNARGRDNTPVGDLKKILDLIRTKMPARGHLTHPYMAAYNYFSRNLWAIDAIDTIAYDLVAGPKQYHAHPGMSEGERLFYLNTGRRHAKLAAKWVAENLSQESNIALKQFKDFYRPATAKAEREAAKRRDEEILNRRYAEELGHRPKEVNSDADFYTRDELDAAAWEILEDDEFGGATRVDFKSLHTPLHPAVVAHLRDGQLKKALVGIAATATEPRLQRLAARLVDYIGDTSTFVTDTAQEFADFVDQYAPKLVDRDALGLYVFPQDPKGMPPRQQAIHDRVRGNIVLNGGGPITLETILHEAIHAATYRILMTNPSHPLTKQVAQLRKRAVDHLGEAEFQGLSSDFEFVADAMSNMLFLDALMQVPMDPSETVRTGPSVGMTWLQKLANFVRSIFGAATTQKPMNTVGSELDAMFYELLSPPTRDGSPGSIGQMAMRQATAAKIMDARHKVAKLTEAQLPMVSSVISDPQIPAGWKDAFLRMTVPVKHLGQMAKGMLPSAPQVEKLIGNHGSELARLQKLVSNSSAHLADWLGKNPDIIKDYAFVAMHATEQEVDPRKPRSFYEAYSLSYNKIDANGDLGDRVELRYKTAAERNNMMSAAREGARNGLNTRPVLGMDPVSPAGKDKLDAWDKMQEPYDRIRRKAGGSNALSEFYALPQQLLEETRAAFRERLNAMTDGNRAVTEKVYKTLIRKMYSDNMIDPFASLRRAGKYWVTYAGYDPVTMGEDGVGDLRVWKHAFQTTQERDKALRLLNDPEVAAKYKITGLAVYENDKQYTGRRAPSMDFMRDLLRRVGEMPSLQDTEGLVQEIMDLFFDAAPETSFIKQFQKREGVPGYLLDITPLQTQPTRRAIIDGMRDYGMRAAHRIADMRYGTQAQQLKTQLDLEIKQYEQEMLASNPRASEAARRHHRALHDFLDAPFRSRHWVSRAATGAGYMLTLGFNVSTALITFLHVPMMVAPYMMAKYGTRPVTKALGFATQVLGTSAGEYTAERVSATGEVVSERTKLKPWDLSISNFDWTNKDNDWIKPLFEMGEKFGIFHRSHTLEYLDVSHATSITQKTVALAGMMQHHAERYVREATLVSSYLLEMHKRFGAGEDFHAFAKRLMAGDVAMDEAAASRVAEFAVEESDLINGQIYAAQAPLASHSSIGSVLYLFKRFPLAMYNMLATIVRELPKGGEERRIATVQLAGIGGMLVAASGVSGLPMFHIVASLWDMMFTDDDEEDFETMMRLALGERGASGLLDYYTGLSVSARVGLSGVFFRPGFATESQPGLFTMLEAMGGPVVGLGIKYSGRTLDLFDQGEIWRGFESAMPSAIANGMRSFRYATDGVKTMRGDPILDSISPYEIGAQAFGFMPARYRAQLKNNEVLRGVDNALRDEVSGLLREYYYARRTGNRRMQQQVREKIKEFNERNPRSRIDYKTVERSLESHQRTSRDMRNGITFSGRNQDTLEEMSRAFGPATWWDK